MSARGARCWLPLMLVRRAAFFAFFTSTLLVSHARLILLNTTTVESLRSQSVRDRDKRVLARMYPWYAVG